MQFSRRDYSDCSYQARSEKIDRYSQCLSSLTRACWSFLNWRLIYELVASQNLERKRKTEGSFFLCMGTKFLHIISLYYFTVNQSHICSLVFYKCLMNELECIVHHSMRHLKTNQRIVRNLPNNYNNKKLDKTYRRNER